MAPDLSAVSNSTMVRPRAATSAPAMASQSPTPRQPVHGPHISTALPPPGSPPLGTGDYGISSTAQGPLRHPQPLTPSDLYLVLEKEQEAMVNRLTRELSILRQQTASVVSTASSTSTFNEADRAQASPTLSSSIPSHSARRNRSNSSLSSHASANQAQQSASVTGIAPSRDIPYRQTDHSRTQRIPTPELGIPDPPRPFPGGSLSRFEEATHHRLEVEYMKRENEQLRRRVRDLEQTLKRQKEDSASEASATPPERIINA
ncbi:hypothetical protein N7449_001366 [Penicillium cf. viridicatum]|uniref:Uncharacterized protein n=1 Tax=Penicillium cf. viridicatum TaxID=2972119 RepID=A0A9W9N6J9_9EURO|nr:hypothetical protein N7449_001366 [Penicillium cf. viridicatum]